MERRVIKLQNPSTSSLPSDICKKNAPIVATSFLFKKKIISEKLARM